MKKHKKPERPVQYLTQEYVERTRHATPDQIVEFLEQTKQLLAQESCASVSISLRVPQDLLQVFKSKAEIEGVKYQTLIKKLMSEYVRGKR